MPSSDITRRPHARSGGDRQALDELFPLVYQELRRIARSNLAGERRGHTLDSVALVGEAYAKLVEQQQLPATSRAHFFGTAAGAMRRILVDHARGRNAAKRGSGNAAVPLDGMTAQLSDDGAQDLIELDLALQRLAQIDGVACRVVECLYFGGLTYDEIATTLEIGASTVRRRWRFARAWLKRELAR